MFELTLGAVVDLLNQAPVHAMGAPVSNAEILGFATGALCVWLVARQNVASWPIGIANNLVWILLFATAGLFADSLLQVIYIALALWGWWAWTHRDGRRGDLPVSSTTAAQWRWLLLAGLAGTLTLTWALDTQTASSVPFLDALTTTLSLLATWGQIRKKVQSWWLWMLADVIYVPLYAYKGLNLTAVLYVGFFALCVRGYLAWREDLAAGTHGAGTASEHARPRPDPLTQPVVAA